MVIAFSLTTFFISKQWGDMDTMMVPMLTRMYGEDNNGYTINSINTWLCMPLPTMLAAFTGPMETFSVIMPVRPPAIVSDCSPSPTLSNRAIALGWGAPSPGRSATTPIAAL